MKLEFSRQIFEKVSNIKFNESPYSGNRTVLCVRTERNLRIKQSLFAILPTRLKTWSGWYNTVQVSVCEGFPGVLFVPQRILTREWRIFSHAKSQCVQYLQPGDHTTGSNFLTGTANDDNRNHVFFSETKLDLPVKSPTLATHICG